MHPYYAGSGGYGMSTGFGLFSFAIHVVIIALVIWFVIWLIRGGRRGRRMGGMGMWHMHSALGILDERFAKGEINKEEYEERKKTLLGEVK